MLLPALRYAICFLLFIQTAYALPDPQRIDAFFDDYPSQVFGVVIVEPNSNQTIYSRHGEKLFHPASTVKLFTSYAALKGLGKDYRFQTRLAWQGNLQGPTLQGNVFIQFGGDPSLKDTHLFQLFKSLSSKGIRTIEGNVVIDDQFFDHQYYSLGREWEDLVWYYGAPVHPIIINENAAKLHITPSKTRYQPVTLLQKTQNAPSLIGNNQTITVSDDEAKHHCTLLVKSNNQRYDFSGCWSEKRTQTLNMAISDPRTFAQFHIQKILSDLNIQLNGNIQFNKMPTDAKVLALHESQPLTELIGPVLSDSNNLYSEVFVKALGKKFYNSGSFGHGTKAMMKILNEHANLDEAHMRFADGSGASNYNLLSPSIIAELLKVIHEDQELKALFEKNYAKGGERGKLEKRLDPEKINADFLGKTAARPNSGIHGVSGILKTHHGKTLIVVALMNNANVQAWEGRLIIDRIIEKVAKESE